MTDTCKCGGVLKLDRRVHFTTGETLDHLRCTVCNRHVVVPVVQTPEDLENAVRRGYAGR